jgi:hypothetical protein
MLLISLAKKCFIFDFISQTSNEHTHTLKQSTTDKEVFLCDMSSMLFFFFISKYSNQNSQCQHHRCSSFNDPNYFSFEVSHFTLFIFIFFATMNSLFCHRN